MFDLTFSIVIVTPVRNYVVSGFFVCYIFSDDFQSCVFFGLYVPSYLSNERKEEEKPGTSCFG